MSDALYTCPFLNLAQQMSRESTPPPHLSRPSHLTPHQHIVASSSNPVLVHQSSYLIYSYLATQIRQSSLGNLADANSDIDAIFGNFDRTDNDAAHKEGSSPQAETPDSYTKRLQDMFSLFIEIGHPERTYSTPAHLGSYLLAQDVQLEKRRKICKFWERWKDLAKRY